VLTDDESDVVGWATPKFFCGSDDNEQRDTISLPTVRSFAAPFAARDTNVSGIAGTAPEHDMSMTLYYAIA
jgi:hypothetical protein